MQIYQAMSLDTTARTSQTLESVSFSQGLQRFNDVGKRIQHLASWKHAPMSFSKDGNFLRFQQVKDIAPPSRCPNYDGNTASALGLFLGFFGADRFYLGYITFASLKTVGSLFFVITLAFIAKIAERKSRKTRHQTEEEIRNEPGASVLWCMLAYFYVLLLILWCAFLLSELVLLFSDSMHPLDGCPLT